MKTLAFIEEIAEKMQKAGETFNAEHMMSVYDEISHLDEESAIKRLVEISNDLKLKMIISDLVERQTLWTKKLNIESILQHCNI